MRLELLALAGAALSYYWYRNQPTSTSASPSPVIEPQPTAAPDLPSIDDLFNLDWSPIWGNTDMSNDNQPNQNLPKGIRNNNPLNIRDYGIPWQGWKGTDSTGFVVFETMHDGIRAAARDMKTKRGRGIDSIAEIVDVWAPHSGDFGDDNPTQNYIEFVEKRSGISRIKILSGYDYVKVIEAMAYFENGGNYLTMKQVEKGVRAGGLL